MTADDAEMASGNSEWSPQAFLAREYSWTYLRSDPFHPPIVKRILFNFHNGIGKLYLAVGISERLLYYPLGFIFLNYE